MTEFKMPTDISEKEKIAGGILTAQQLIWLAIGIGITVGLGLLLYEVIDKIGFIISALIGIPFGCVFAFLKPHKIPLMKFFILEFRHKKSLKKLPNHDPEIDSFKLDYFKKERL